VNRGKGIKGELTGMKGMKRDTPLNRILFFGHPLESPLSLLTAFLIDASLQPANLSSPSAFIGDPDFQTLALASGFPNRIASGMTVCKKAADEQ
jgi:hypothetical protein